MEFVFPAAVNAALYILHHLLPMEPADAQRSSRRDVSIRFIQVAGGGHVTVQNRWTKLVYQ